MRQDAKDARMRAWRASDGSPEWVGLYHPGSHRTTAHLASKGQHAGTWILACSGIEAMPQFPALTNRDYDRCTECLETC